jgi:hypothetical protein
MMLHAAEDTVYIHGGYSREKKAVNSSGKHTGGKTEGVVHQDTWMINLKPLLGGTAGGGGATASGGAKGKLDFSKVTWQKVSRKGSVPSTRSGMAILSYKNKGIVFGGVKDEEGHGHSMTSTFYNDLYAFDFDRRRWFQLGLKNKAAAAAAAANSKAAKQAKKAQKQAAALVAATASSKEGKGKKRKSRKKRGGDDDADAGDASGSAESGDDGSHSSDDDENDSCSDSSSDSEGGPDEVEDLMASGDFFGYIDEAGNVVYVDLNAPEETDPTSNTTTATTTSNSGANSNIAISEEEAIESVFNMITMSDTLASTTTTAGGRAEGKPSAQNMLSGLAAAESKGEEKRAAVTASAPVLKHSSSSTSTPVPAPIGPLNLAKYFSSLTEPAPRINAAVCIKGGSTLVVYGGVTELGDIEVTLDDCWTLDLNKRDVWRCVLPGTMHQLQWKGEVDDNTSATSAMGSDDDDDDGSDEDSDGDSDDSSADDDDDDEGGDNEADEVEEGCVTPVKKDGKRDKEEKGKKNKKKDRRDEDEGSQEVSKPKKKSSTTTALDASGASISLRKATRDRSGLQLHGSRGGGGEAAGVLAELQALRAQLPNDGAETETPGPWESLREFFG